MEKRIFDVIGYPAVRGWRYRQVSNGLAAGEKEWTGL